MDYREHYSTLQTPQSEPLDKQVPNSAGGHAYLVNDWQRLDRFLILGSEGGSYYAGERELTRENAKVVGRCLEQDGLRVVRTIVEISDSGRAPKNDPALFALAMAASDSGNKHTRRAALDALPQVARTGTHLFQFVHYVEGFRGWGRALRRAVRAWYCDRSAQSLAYQAVKYQQRGGWSHRDLLRLAHPKTKPSDKERRALFDFICKSKSGAWVENDNVLPIVRAAYIARTEPKADVPQLIREYKLPREAVPTQSLNDPKVWAALLEEMPLMAMVRNLGKMSSVGFLRPMTDQEDLIVSRLKSMDRIVASRIHPLHILMAQTVYEAGKGVRGSLTWEVSAKVVDALNDAFYLAFKSVQAAGKRHLLAVDVSGSMTWDAIAGTFLTPRDAAGAMTLVTHATEPHCHTVAFSASGTGHWSAKARDSSPYRHDGLTPLPISSKQRLSDVVRTMNSMMAGGTDCALPMLYAIDKQLSIDVFVVYTDSETWAGKIHPVQALREYRRKSGINAKLVVVGMVANEFSIADPDDAGTLDVVGFDTATPQVIADFAR